MVMMVTSVTAVGAFVLAAHKGVNVSLSGLFRGSGIMMLTGMNPVIMVGQVGNIA